MTYDLDGSGGTIVHPVTGANVSSDGATRVSITAGQNRTDVDFGYDALVLLGSVSGIAWYDQDASGNAPAGTAEYGFSGVMVTLSGTDSLGNSVSRTTVTSSTGLYYFGSVSAGTYETLVNTSTLGSAGVNFIQTYDIDGTGSVSRAGFALTAGQNRTSVNYGYQLLSTLSGIVWLDPNSSGVSPEV